MRVLDRYILKPVLGMFLLCVVTFFFLYVIIDLFSHLDEILSRSVPLEVLRQYYVGFLPLIFVQIAPFSCLLSTLFVFAKLSQNNELIAMRASGLSIPQVSRTVVIFGLIVSLGIFWLNDRLMPQLKDMGMAAKEQMQGDDKKKQSRQEVIKYIALYGSHNSLFFAEKFFPRTNTLEGITVLEQDTQQNVTKKIIARRGSYRDGLWTFYESTTFSFDASGQLVGDPVFLPEEMMDFTEKPDDFLNQRQSSEMMDIGQLQEYIWRLSRSGATGVVRQLKVDLYERFTLPFASLVLVFLAIPFAFRIRKRGASLASFGIALAVGFLYYVINAISIALGKAGYLAPALSVSLSHCLALALSAYLIHELP